MREAHAPHVWVLEMVGPTFGLYSWEHYILTTSVMQKYHVTDE